MKTIGRLAKWILQSKHCIHCNGSEGMSECTMCPVTHFVVTTECFACQPHLLSLHNLQANRSCEVHDDCGCNLSWEYLSCTWPCSFLLSCCSNVEHNHFFFSIIYRNNPSVCFPSSARDMANIRSPSKIMKVLLS